ncbi:hypothetical protein tb265_15190 [Gemmatimonadetes bacterium T265]|nr:hypothetical protein tb265_15190 [Gemmatimonadetes bacterium T265]
MPTPPPPAVARQSAYVLAGTAVGMFAYELAKSVLLPGLTLWQSHAITIAVSSVGAAVAAHRALGAQARLHALAAAEANAARYGVLFDASPRPMWVYDVETTAFLAVNEAALRQYGYTRDEFLARTIRDVRPDADVATLDAHLATMPPGYNPSGTWRHQTRAGAVLDVEITSHPVEWEGRPARLVLINDVTRRAQLEAQLAYQAFHDGLTGLANRALFRDRVDHALERARGARAGATVEYVAVLFLDLDNFKAVNDSLGHAEGDRLLRHVADRLRRATRGFDTVARLGGDEFAVLLEGLTAPDDAQVVAARVQAALAAPGAGAERDARAQASLGLAHATPEVTADELLRNADTAMYAAKSAGKGRSALFVPSMHQAVVARRELERDLRDTLEHPAYPGLSLAYQPVVELAGGGVVGVEALFRWRHPERGPVSPADSIPMAEESGLIVPLGSWVLREACRQLAAWRAQRAAAAGAVKMSVNVSGRQLEDPAFADEVAAVLAEFGLPAHRLTLEVTETAVMRDTARSVAALHALKALGVGVALDDFGTGYSSLSYLQQFPIDVLKIDKRFVDGVASGGEDAALARTIVALGQTLGLRTVAEGVETAEQRDALAGFGCLLGQGYLFARPLPADEAGRLLARPAGVARGG